MMSRRFIRTQGTATAEPSREDFVEVPMALIVRPCGLMMLIVGGPNIDPFKRIDPSTEEFRIWVELSGRGDQIRHRLEFVSPKRIARSYCLDKLAPFECEALRIQSVVDIFVLELPSSAAGLAASLQNDIECTECLHLLPSVESSPSSWAKLQALRVQFQPELGR